LSKTEDSLALYG